MTQHLTMAQVINIGASRRPVPQPCPFCGEDPPLASMDRNRFVVGCVGDDCPACPEVSADTLEGAWAAWNKRS